MFDLMYESVVHEPAEPVATKCHVWTLIGADGNCIHILIGGWVDAPAIAA
jgi:hypothetical protein